MTAIITRVLRRTLQKEEAASMVEYALLLLLIVVVTVAAISALGGTISNMLDSFAQMIP